MADKKEKKSFNERLKINTSFEEAIQILIQEEPKKKDNKKQSLYNANEGTAHSSPALK